MKKIAPWIFVLFFVGLSLCYNYQEILFKKPQSLHRWRQCEGASIAMNYYNHGMQFFHPEVFFQIGDGGTSGYAVGECPILYYAVAALWKLFGHSDFIFRGLNFLIFFLGLFALFRMLQRVLKNNFWAITVPLLFFTSPVIVFYSGNYLTDTTALAFSLMGWNSISKYYMEQQRKSFYLAILFFTLAGLLKIVALISVFTILGIFLLGTFRAKSSNIQDMFKLNAKKAISFAALFAIVFGWYMFAIHYNKTHRAFVYDGSSYFLTGIFPIWDLSSKTIKDVVVEVWERWRPDYFNISIQVLLLACVLFVLLYMRKLEKFWRAVSVLMLLGMLCFGLLWFYLFAIHDYYMINPLLMPIFFLIASLIILKDNFQNLFASNLLKAAFLILLLFNVYYAKGKQEERYTGWVNEYPDYREMHTIKPYLKEIGIRPGDKVICLPDGTTNYTLYLMNQPGWTGINFFNDSLQVKKYISLGAKYLILTAEEPLSRPCLQPFIGNKVGQYGRVSIFKL